MTTKNINGSLFVGLTALVLLIAGLVVVGVASQTQQARAGGYAFSICDSNAGTKSEGSTTTLTALYNTLGQGSATSTITCPTSQASSVDINVFAVSTTTPATPVILWTVWGSNNGQDWYLADVNSTSGTTITHTTGTTTNAWAPGQAATTTRSTTVTPWNERYMRVQFSGSVATSSVYIQLIPHNTITN